VLLLGAGAFSGGGCIGHIMGWASSEVDRTRRVVAELETKNAALVEETLRLKAELESIETGNKPGKTEPRRLDAVDM